MMQEFILNVHNHTRYSDGAATHRELAQAACVAGIDGVFVTDHNVMVKNLAGYYPCGERRILILVGEEIHDRQLLPQKNHLLVLGADVELTGHAHDTNQLLAQIEAHGGLAFIAHPFENALSLFNETDITWEAWGLNGFAGLEVWNGLSEIKTVIHNKLEAVFYALFPNHIAHGPNLQAMKKWDELNAAGAKLYAIGGTDSHQLRVSMGPFKRTLFPYDWHYQTINNHLLLKDELSGDHIADQALVMEALASGRYFIGYDLPELTSGFRFYANNHGGRIEMGQTIVGDAPVTLQANIPAKALAVLYRNGQEVARWVRQDKCAYHVDQPGVYRMQCYLRYLGKLRTWIIANPIFIQNS